jgi:two-component system sensor histidine kinase PilS (NtrC family)
MFSTLRRKLLWLIVGRAAAATLLLGSAPLIRERSGLPIDPFYVLLACTYVLTVAYAMALKYLERYRWLVDVQLALDAVVVSGIVYMTGGVSSYFSTLYTLPIIAASTVESRRTGMTVGVLSCVLYVGLVMAQYADPEGFQRTTGWRASLPAVRLSVYTVCLNVFGFFAVATLSGYLSEGLRRADAQLQQASNQIEDLQAFSRHVIDSLTSGLTTTDVDGRIATFNRAAVAITGIAARDAIGRSVVDVLSLPEQFRQAFRANEGRLPLPRMEWLFTRADGQQIELGSATAPLVTPRGETGFLVTFQDVTEARKQEREARIQQRLAAVGEMAAGIAHEIRNPLASMAGSIQILRQELPLSPDQSQLMDIVLRESERLNETIRSFLAFARPQRQNSAPVDIRRVVTDAARLLENSSELTDRHHISVDVPADDVVLDADEGQLRQIVWNLATNGLRAMPNGGRLTLAIKERVLEDHVTREVVLSVGDEGTGIAAEDLDGIFQPFRGAFSRGTGLGLSIVRRIIAEYGGEIQVTSERGAGTTVNVRFPTRRTTDEPVTTGKGE